jgi:hypothetical protein
LELDRRALPTAARIALPPRGYEAVPGGFIRRDVPPPGWRKPEEQAKRGVFRPSASVASPFGSGSSNGPSPTQTKQLVRKEAPETVTSTSWITTDDCQPTSPVDNPSDDDCDEEDDYLTPEPAVSTATPPPSTSSGMLSEATSSADGGLVSHAPEPSEAHVGECSAYARTALRYRRRDSARGIQRRRTGEASMGKELRLGSAARRRRSVRQNVVVSAHELLHREVRGERPLPCTCLGRRPWV